MRFALFHILQAGARGEQRAIAGQGPHRARLRRPRLLGHRDVRAAGAHLHRAARRRATRCAGATRRSRPPASARASSGWRARRSLADDRAARSARATGRPAPPPSTSTPTSPTPSCATWRRPATRSSSARSGVELLVETARLWRSLGHHDAAGAFRIDGVTGPDEYSARRRQQRLHEPDGAAQPARGGRRRRAPPRAGRARSASTTRRSAAGATAARRDVHPLRRGARRPPAVGGLHRARALGLRRDPARPVPAAAALPLLRPVPQAGGQAGRSRARDAPARRRLHAPSRRRATSPTTSGSPCATPRCRRAPRR